MGKKSRKYYYADGISLSSYDKKSFLVFWKENEKQRLSNSSGPYMDFKEAENIMVDHLISGVCSWIVSYNG